MMMIINIDMIINDDDDHYRHKEDKYSTCCVDQSQSDVYLL